MVRHGSRRNTSGPFFSLLARDWSVDMYYLGRLSGILQKRTLSSDKLDEIKVKVNILSSFLNQQVEKVKEKVKGEL